MSIDTKSDPLAAALESDDLKRQLEAIAEVTREARARCSERALAALIECLGDSRKVVQRRAADALGAAAAHDPRIVPGLRAALDSEPAGRRWGAAYALSLIDRALDLRAHNALLEALANPDGDVRWAAKDLLVRLAGEHPDEVRRSLIALQELPEGHPDDHRDHNARKMALYALRDLKFAGPEVRAMAARASRAAESAVRLAALSLLAQLADASDAAQGEAEDEAIDIALRCLESDPDPGVRRAAASALGHLGTAPRAAQALERAASQTADPGLAKAARHTLARIAK